MSLISAMATHCERWSIAHRGAVLVRSLWRRRDRCAYSVQSDHRRVSCQTTTPMDTVRDRSTVVDLTRVPLRYRTRDSVIGVADSCASRGIAAAGSTLRCTAGDAVDGPEGSELAEKLSTAADVLEQFPHTEHVGRALHIAGAIAGAAKASGVGKKVVAAVSNVVRRFS